MPTKQARDPSGRPPRNAQSFPSEAAVVLCPAALARFLSIWVDLFPRSPPPHTRRCSSYLSELSHQTPSAPDNHNNNKDSQVSLGCANKRSKLPLILALHFLKSDNGSRLLVHNSSETSFTLHDDVGAAHLAAQGGEEDDELDSRVDVVRDDDEGGFLGFDEGDDVVEAVFDKEGFFGVLLMTMSEVK